jgi:hypothetical protein
MKEDKLRKYFGELLQKEGYISSDSMAVLGKLIRVTLEYRDRIVSEKGQTLTVEETRVALDIFQTAVKTEKLPAKLDPKIRELIVLWFREIYGRGF